MTPCEQKFELVSLSRKGKKEERKEDGVRGIFDEEVNEKIKNLFEFYF
jgi:hypothetical protein